MILCASCSKPIKVKGKRLRTCSKCGKPVCVGCMVQSHCKECHPNNTTAMLFDEYFREKYGKIFT